MGLIKLCKNFVFGNGDECKKPHFANVTKQEGDIVVCNMITHAEGTDRVPLKQSETSMPIDKNSKILTKKAIAEVVKDKYNREIVVGEFFGNLKKK